jgi:hypothetical protein
MNIAYLNNVMMPNEKGGLADQIASLPNLGFRRGFEAFRHEHGRFV